MGQKHKLGNCPARSFLAAVPRSGRLQSAIGLAGLDSLLTQFGLEQIDRKRPRVHAQVEGKRTSWCSFYRRSPRICFFGFLSYSHLRSVVSSGIWALPPCSCASSLQSCQVSSAASLRRGSARAENGCSSLVSCSLLLLRCRIFRFIVLANTIQPREGPVGRRLA
jgi:hypothetical protein